MRLFDDDALEAEDDKQTGTTRELGIWIAPHIDKSQFMVSDLS